MISRDDMRRLELTTLGAWCGILTTAAFVVGIACTATSGVQVLIPETGGHKTIDWIDDVNAASGAFFAGAWLVILGGFFALVAVVGFYFALREAGPVMLLAPILGAAGMVLVQISHLIPIALAYRLAPDSGPWSRRSSPGRSSSRASCRAGSAGSAL
jgi:hypothetical protein